jgi:beta-galactosidase
LESNAVAPEFLSLCDEMGFLVMDETFDTWEAKKSNAERGYNLYFKDWWERDTRDIILKDRNHPSIVIYSIGNEIHDNLNDTSGFRKYKMQQDLVHSLDTTRLVTMALFRPALSHVYENGLAASMDVVGQNYRENELIAAHEKHPEWKVIGTENTHVISQWLALRDKPYMSGQFLWTGFDYLGENDWPKIANGQGLYDKANGTKANTYQRKSWWNDEPMVYVMRKEGNAGTGDWVSDWTPTDIDTYDEARVQVFSNCDEVELFLNGKSEGVKGRTEDNASARIWSFPFQKGILKAVARNKGKVVAEQELKTATAAAKIKLSIDKPTIQNNWDDVVYVTAMVTDENGNDILTADNKIKFSIEGAGVIAAVDNGDIASTEPYQATERWAYKGRCIAVIKAKADSGIIKLTAKADGLKEASVTVTVVK